MADGSATGAAPAHAPEAAHEHGHGHDHGHAHDDHGHSHDDHGHSHGDHGHSHGDHSHDDAAVGDVLYDTDDGLPLHVVHAGHLDHDLSACAQCQELHARVKAFFDMPVKRRQSVLRVDPAAVLSVVQSTTSCPGCAAGVKGILADGHLQGLSDTIGDGTLVVVRGGPTGGGRAGGKKSKRGGGSSGGPGSSAGSGSGSGAAAGRGTAVSFCDERCCNREVLSETLRLFDLHSWLRDCAGSTALTSGAARSGKGGQGRKRCQYHVLQPVASQGYEWREMLSQRLVCDVLLPEVTVIPLTYLDTAVDSLLHVHRFCKECAHNVNIAYHRLVGRPDPIAPAPDDDTYADALFDVFALGCTIHIPARPGVDEVPAGQPAIVVSYAHVADLIERGVRDNDDDADAKALGQHPDHRHATTLYQGQLQVLSCVGSALLERLLKARLQRDTTTFLHELTVRATATALDNQITAAVQEDSQNLLLMQLLSDNPEAQLALVGEAAVSSDKSKKSKRQAAKERRESERAEAAAKAKAKAKAASASASTSASAGSGGATDQRDRLSRGKSGASAGAGTAGGGADSGAGAGGKAGGAPTAGAKPRAADPPLPPSAAGSVARKGGSSGKRDSSGSVGGAGDGKQQGTRGVGSGAVAAPTTRAASGGVTDLAAAFDGPFDDDDGGGDADDDLSRLMASMRMSAGGGMDSPLAIGSDGEDGSGSGELGLDPAEIRKIKEAREAQRDQMRAKFKTSFDKWVAKEKGAGVGEGAGAGTS